MSTPTGGGTAARWLVRVDIAVAAALSAGALMALGSIHYRAPFVVAAVLAVGCTSTVAWRRAVPLLAAGVACVSVAAYQRATHDPLGTFVAPAVVADFYLVGRRRAAFSSADRRPLIAIGGVALVAVAVSEVNDLTVGSLALAWFPLVVLPAALGVAAARSASVAARLAEANRQLEAQRGLIAARAAAEERNRVARDLHDMVAHGVSVAVIHAGAASVVADDDPSAVGRALPLIASVGRQALTDLRQLTGVLHRDDDAVLGPELSIARLDELIEEARRSGVDAYLRVSVARHPATPVDVAVYRVVQEALTNVIKHAPGATALVDVAGDGDVISVVVADDGGRSCALGLESGHGLQGMAERVAACGGTLRTGYLEGGGYEVRARLPLQPQPRTPGQLPETGIASTRALGPGPLARIVDIAFVMTSLVALEAEVFTSGAHTRRLALNAVLAAAMVAAGIWRRRAPLAVLVAIGVLAIAMAGGLASTDRATVVGTFTLIVPLYSIARWGSRWHLAIGAVTWTVGAVIVSAMNRAAPGGSIGALMMGAAVVVGGRTIRHHRGTVTALARAARELESTHQERARLAVVNERARIARELQGRVATDLVNMVAMAEGVMAGSANGDDGRSALGAIEHAGRDALAQLRHILGVLRGDGAPPRSPSSVAPAGMQA